MSESPQSAATTPGTSTRHVGVVLLIVLVSYFMIVLNNSIVFTGLAQLENELRLSAGELSWVQNAYTLLFGGLLLLGARAGDLLGRRRVFIAGLAVFGIASMLVGLAPDGVLLIAARAVQGVGAAIVAPASLALITATFPAGHARQRAIAAYGTTAGIGGSLGMVIGGVLASALSWRAGFFLSAVLAVVMIAVGVRFLPSFAAQRGRFDLIGAIASTLGMGALIFGIVNASEQGWTAPLTLASLVVGAFVLIGFVLIQWRARQPIMPLRLFRSAERSGAAVARLLFAGAIIAFFYFTAQLLQARYDWSPLQVGFAFLPMTIPQFLVSLPIAALVRRFGNAALVITGLAVTIVGAGWLVAFTPDTSYLGGIVGPMILLGIGQGLAFGPLTAVGVAGADPADAGAASGLVNTMHQLGSTVGVAALTAAGAGAATLTGQVIDSYRGTAIMLSLALIALLVTLVPLAIHRRRVESFPAARSASSNPLTPLSKELS